MDWGTTEYKIIRNWTPRKERLAREQRAREAREQEQSQQEPAKDVPDSGKTSVSVAVPVICIIIIMLEVSTNMHFMMNKHHSILFLAHVNGQLLPILALTCLPSFIN